jgi:hypothetical protein
LDGLESEELMDIPILVEKVTDRNCYRARAGEPFAIEAEGVSVHDALENVENAIRRKLQDGAMIFHFELKLTPSLLRGAGIWPNDEITRNWLEGIEEYRRQMDDRDLPGETNADSSPLTEANGTVAKSTPRSETLSIEK